MRSKSWWFIKRGKKLKSYFVYKQSDINEILFNTPLLMVIKDYVVLRKKGSDYVGRCPFCKTFTENDFHFRVSEKKRVYKCFECGISGKLASTFLKKYYNISFDKSLRYINGKYHNYKYKMDYERIVLDKTRGNIGEDLPF